MSLKRKLPSGPEWDSDPFFTARPPLIEPVAEEFSQFINLPTVPVSLSSALDPLTSPVLPSTSSWDFSPPPPLHSPSLYNSGEKPTDGSQPTRNDNPPARAEPFFKYQIELDPALGGEDEYFNFSPFSANDPIPPTSLPFVAIAKPPSSPAPTNPDAGPTPNNISKSSNPKPKRQSKPPTPPPSTTATRTTRSRKRRTVLSAPAQEAKREHFLQRNKQAAQRCRQNKKMQVLGLQTRANTLGQRRADMQLLVGGLRQEVLILRGLLGLCDGGGCLVQGRGIGGGVDLGKMEEMADENEGEAREGEGEALSRLLFKIEDNDYDDDNDEHEKRPDQLTITAA